MHPGKYFSRARVTPAGWSGLSSFSCQCLFSGFLSLVMSVYQEYVQYRGRFVHAKRTMCDTQRETRAYVQHKCSVWPSMVMMRLECGTFTAHRLFGHLSSLYISMKSEASWSWLGKLSDILSCIVCFVFLALYLGKHCFFGLASHAAGSEARNKERSFLSFSDFDVSCLYTPCSANQAKLTNISLTRKSKLCAKYSTPGKPSHMVWWKYF